MNDIGARIKKFRESKGITQDYMAFELGITQPNYGRLEKDDSRINIPKLQKISEVLDVNISVLFNEKMANVIHHNQGDNAQATIHSIIQDKELINSLKEEISFLRNILKEKVRVTID